MELNEIKKYIKETLSEKRFFHSLCVMERCEELAKKIGVDEIVAKKVGIAHDVAKEMTNEEKLRYIKENEIEVDDMEKINTGLLHAKIGADIAVKKFEFTEKMGQSIKAHTTGLPDMDLLAKVLFIADRTSKERNFPDIDQINKIIEHNIDEAILYILDEKIKLQINKKATMHVNSIITRNELLKNI